MMADQRALKCCPTTLPGRTAAGTTPRDAAGRPAPGRALPVDVPLPDVPPAGRTTAVVATPAQRYSPASMYRC